MKKELNFKDWKIDSIENGSIFNIYYKNKLLIDEINFFHLDPNLDLPIQKIMKNNYLSKLPLSFKKIVEVASFDHFFQKKYLFKKSLKFDYFTGNIYLNQTLEVKSDYILFSLKIKTNQDYFNSIKPILKLSSKTTSIFNIEKKKKDIFKSKISSLKIVNISRNMPILVNYFDHNKGFNFLIKTSFPKLYINKKDLSFSPLSEGSDKNILKNWKVKSKINYTISFLIQRNEKNNQKII